MAKYNFLCAEGSKLNQIICAVLINLPMLAYGSAIGWMSPMTLLLQSDQSPRGTPLTDQEISWMASAAYFTSIPANFLFAYLADRFGRKISMLICSSQFVCCWLVMLSSMETWALVLARALVGTGMAGCYVITPLYVKEISENCIRGALASLMILNQTLGTLLLYVLGDVLSYRACLLACLAVPAAHLLLFVMMPESPAFLVRNGDIKEGTRVMAWLRCRSESDPSVQLEINTIRKELEQESGSKKFALRGILADKILFRAFRIAMVLTLAREICGAVPVLNYAGDIFRMTSEGGSGLQITPNQQAMVLGVFQVAGSAVASSFVEKTGRKVLLISTSTVFGVSMLGLSSWFLLRTLGIDAPSWLPIGSLWLCIFCNGCGLQPVSIVIVSELFSFQYRSTVSAITSSTGCFADFIQMLLFKPLASLVGIHTLFYGFAGICFAHSLYVTFVVPETKLRNLEEIYHRLKTRAEIEEDEKVLKIKELGAVV
ncbi:unnamed protein product [Plutella xylostella]|uniref:(diamondback moth) hypothetical protein n=1 Tax=Plutella xylostella TaxID=51655 RepID=A0A8S4FVZ9_PLUXY|nr:unnamed protein product [Plutella xylostella]